MLAKYLFVVVAAVVGSVMAVKCDAQNQFDTCLQNMKGTYTDHCGPNDAVCLCKAHKIILNNCYPLCPNDPGKGSEESVVSSWCVAAGGDKETSSTVVVLAPSTTASTGATGTYPVPSGTTTPTTSSTSNHNASGTTTTTSKSQQTGNVGNMLAPAGFMVAAAAVAGLVL